MPAAPIYAAVMNPKSELKRLTEAVLRADAELDAATKLSEVKSAARKLMRAKEALLRLQAQPAATHPSASREAAKAPAS